MYITVKEQNGLLIHKYKNKVFYDNLWDTLVDSHLSKDIREFRGLVTDKAGNIVSYPFTKIHNYMENGTTIPLNHQVLAYEKINGFMACCSLYKGEVLVSTTGSLTSSFVDMAKAMLPMLALQMYMVSGYSYCFEIVHPNDPHIIVEKVGCYLIGIRKNEIGSKQEFFALDSIANKLGVHVPKHYIMPFEELLVMAKIAKIEGYVVYDLCSDVVLKLKTPYYLIQKFLARTKKDFFDASFKQLVDEEFYPLCEYLREKYTYKTWRELGEQERLTILREYYENIR